MTQKSLAELGAFGNVNFLEMKEEIHLKNLKRLIFSPMPWDRQSSIPEFLELMDKVQQKLQLKTLDFLEQWFERYDKLYEEIKDHLFSFSKITNKIHLILHSNCLSEEQIADRQTFFESNFEGFESKFLDKNPDEEVFKIEVIKIDF